MRCTANIQVLVQPATHCPLRAINMHSMQAKANQCIQWKYELAFSNRLSKNDASGLTDCTDTLHPHQNRRKRPQEMQPQAQMPRLHISIRWKMRKSLLMKQTQGRMRAFVLPISETTWLAGKRKQKGFESGFWVIRLRVVSSHATKQDATFVRRAHPCVACCLQLSMRLKGQKGMQAMSLNGKIA